jgi:hypothetical protein
MVEQAEVRRPEHLADGAGRPPVSTATGGLMPGIDLDKISALQEIEDAEMMGRVVVATTCLRRHAE